MSLLSRFTRDILPPPDAPLLAAVSGGADSLSLLGLLLEAGFRPIVAHVNHGLHPRSAEWAGQVAALAAALQLPFVLARVDARAFAREHKYSLEEAARVLRYAALARLAVEQGAAHLATGHTADDQAETVLMHFLRGAGLAGLRGMLPVTEIPNFKLQTSNFKSQIPILLRPMLAISRAETEQ